MIKELGRFNRGLCRKDKVVRIVASQEIFFVMMRVPTKVMFCHWLAAKGAARRWRLSVNQ